MKLMRNKEFRHISVQKVTFGQPAKKALYQNSIKAILQWKVNN